MVISLGEKMTKVDWRGGDSTPAKFFATSNRRSSVFLRRVTAGAAFFCDE